MWRLWACEVRFARAARKAGGARSRRREGGPAPRDRPRDESTCRMDLGRKAQKSMSPPPGIPPPAPADAFSGLSATTASVVRNSAAMDAAFCSADG